MESGINRRRRFWSKAELRVEKCCESAAQGISCAVCRTISAVIVAVDRQSKEYLVERDIVYVPDREQNCRAPGRLRPNGERHGPGIKDFRQLTDCSPIVARPYTKVGLQFGRFPCSGPPIQFFPRNGHLLDWRPFDHQLAANYDRPDLYFKRAGSCGPEILSETSISRGSPHGTTDEIRVIVSGQVQCQDVRRGCSGNEMGVVLAPPA